MKLPEATFPGYVKMSELFRLVQARRAKLGLPPYKGPNCICSQLQRRGVPFRTFGPAGRNKLYRRADALRACSEMRNSKDKGNWHRNATPEELASGEFLPLPECARRLHCSPARLAGMATHFQILAVRHPVTNRVWVRIKDAERVAYYRTASFLYRYLPQAEARHLIATRPRHERLWEDKLVIRYYVPELSHLGAETTSYKNRQSKIVNRQS